MEGSSSTTRYRFPASSESADHVECSGRSCRSCTAALVADCIALGCCPCAVVNMLALTLVKVPWMVSRRCLESLKRRGAPWRRRVAHVGDVDKMRDVDVMGRQGKSLEMRRKSKKNKEGVVERHNGHASLPSSFEADERIWMELYQVGNWGFGRVSFSGIQREWRPGKNTGASPRCAPPTSGDEEPGKQC